MGGGVWRGGLLHVVSKESFSNYSNSLIIHRRVNKELISATEIRMAGLD